jgi:transcriptional regulator with XRE-family HTH domain
MNADINGLILSYLAKRQVNRATLAKRAGITEAGLSKIYHGTSRPRRDTVLRLIGCLAADFAEANEIWHAFYDEPFPQNKFKSAAPRVSPVVGYDENLKLALAFRDEVKNALERGALPYQFNEEGVVDFVVSLKVKVGIECLTDLGQSWSRRLATAHALRDHIGADRWLICVPAHLLPSGGTLERFSAELVPIVTPDQLVRTLKNLSETARAILQIPLDLSRILQERAKARGMSVESLLTETFSQPESKLEVEELQFPEPKPAAEGPPPPPLDVAEINFTEPLPDAAKPGAASEETGGH